MNHRLTGDICLAIALGSAAVLLEIAIFVLLRLIYAERNGLGLSKSPKPQSAAAARRSVRAYNPT